MAFDREMCLLHMAYDKHEWEPGMEGPAFSDTIHRCKTCGAWMDEQTFMNYQFQTRLRDITQGGWPMPVLEIKDGGELRLKSQEQ